MRIFGIGLALFTGAYTESFAARGFWGIVLYIALILVAVILTSDVPRKLVKRAADRRAWERRQGNL